MKFYISKNKENLAHNLGIGHIKHPPNGGSRRCGQTLDKAAT